VDGHLWGAVAGTVLGLGVIALPWPRKQHRRTSATAS